MINIIRSIVRNFEQNRTGKDLFINCISELKKHKNHQWMNHVWLEGKSIVETLDINEWKIVTESLLDLPNISDDSEEILSILAENFPKYLIEFFCERVKMRLEKNQEETYDVIPFSFYKLHNILRKNPNTIIEEILKWFKVKNWLYNQEGGRLLQLIFPNFHPELEKQLIDLIRSGDQNKAKVVLYILRSYKYNNGSFLHNVCKEFIEKYPKKYQTDMFMVLSQMGTVSGEYGFVKGYERKKDEIQEWKKDTNKIIKEFVQKYEKYLLEQIDYEKKRADEDIAMRKREFET